MYDLERYLGVRSAYGASLGPGGDVAFLMDTTGVPQVWTLDEPDGWPEQRTFGDERVTFGDYSPTRSELAFGRDAGGNERVQLFRLADDGTVTNWTQRPGAKHRWGGWSHDGDRFAFASNRRDEAVFDVYVQGRDATGGDAEMVHEGDGWLGVAGWSPDDDRLLLSKAYSNFDQDLYVLDLNGGDVTHLTPHEGDVRYGSTQWSPDGEAVYLVTDDGADTLYMARLDVETLTVEPVVDGGEYNVDGVALDEETGRLVYSRNVEGYSELTVGELDGPTDVRTLSEPDLVGGVAGGVDFDEDAETFVCSASSRTANTNVHRVGVDDGESDRWTHASTAGIPPGTFRAADVVRYESFDGREIPAFLTLPAETPDGGAPVVVDVHGGPESQRRPSFSGLTQYFCSRGYAVFEPNVRGSTGYGKAYTHLDDVEKRMDAVADLKAGATWLTDRPDVDGDRLVVMGGSYGGFMVLAALTQYPDLWAAGVDVVGIANFVTFLENTGSWRRQLREAEYGSLDENRDLLEAISPINHVEDIAAPLFVVHGANDPRVPVGEAEQIVERAREQGVPVEKLIFDDEGHGITKRENRIDAYTRVVEFLNEHV
ncbi:MAG: prolyl oligopeptidase family serine peptidase [Haloarculaceae archaeon]